MTTEDDAQEESGPEEEGVPGAVNRPVRGYVDEMLRLVAEIAVKSEIPRIDAVAPVTPGNPESGFAGSARNGHHAGQVRVGPVHLQRSQSLCIGGCRAQLAQGSNVVKGDGAVGRRPAAAQVSGPDVELAEHFLNHQVGLTDHQHASLLLPEA